MGSREVTRNLLMCHVTAKKSLFAKKAGLSRPRVTALPPGRPAAAPGRGSELRHSGSKSQALSLYLSLSLSPEALSGFPSLRGFLRVTTVPVTVPLSDSDHDSKLKARACRCRRRQLRGRRQRH